MFTLKIHTVDFPQPLGTTFASATSAAADSNNGLRPAQLMGEAHPFHHLPSASAPAITVANISARTTLLFVVAVPNYLSEDEFLLFCGKDVSHFQEITFLRNDAVEDRYSVLIKLENQMAADGFYCSYNGKRFKPTDVEFVLVCQLCQQQVEKPTCAICGTFKNLWICLICGFVGCGRYEKGHASGHWSDKHHHFSLDLEKQQIWDYVGDRYVHRLNQSKADRKSVVINSHVEECGACGCGEDDGLGGALFNSKIEGILDEYNHLLANQLDEQRLQYETLLAEAKGGKESSIKTAVDKATFSKTREFEDKWGKYAEDKRSVSNRNQELMKKQALLQNKFKEIEERETSLLLSKDEQILDMQEQIRDLKVYVEAQKMVTSMEDSNSFLGGTVLPVEPNQPSSGNGKRRDGLRSSTLLMPL